MKKMAMLWAVLMLGCGAARGASDEGLHVSSLALAGAIDGENITFELTFHVEVRERGVTLPLVVGDVAYLEGSLPKRCELTRDGQTYLLRFQSKGESEVRFKFASRPLREGDWRRTRFEIPAAGVRKLSVLCDRDDLEIAFPGALDVQREKTADRKLLATAFLGVAGKFEIGWKPEVKKLDSELVVTCDANVIATASVGALRLDTVLTYRVIQGRLAHLAVRLPEINVTQVRGEHIQDWRIDRTDPTGPCLLVDLSRPAESIYRLQIESELVVPEFPCKFEMPVFAPEGVIRSSGFMMIGTDSAIKLQIDKAAGVTQVDQEVFPAVVADQNVTRAKPGRVLYAYQYANTPYTVAVTADDVVTSLTADDRLVLKMAENELTLSASFEIEIKDAPARELVIEATVARGWTVTGVSGRSVVETDVDIQELGDKRVLHIPFAQAVSGTLLVDVQMEMPLGKEQAAFQMPEFKVTGAKSERGYIVLAAEQGVRLKADNLAGMREVHTGSAPMRVPGALQAFRFRDTGWSLSLLVERANPSIHCEVFHLASVGEGVSYHSIAVTYHIGGAPVQEVRLAVPEEIQSVEFTGADIEGWTRDKNVCTVRFQDRVLGDYTLLVTFDRQFADDGAEIDIGRVATLGTESEVGYVAVASSLSLDVTEAAPLPPSVILIDRGELPPAYAAPVTDPILRAYKILRTPHPMTLRLAPYDTEQLLGQVADYVMLSTRLSKDGESVTTATCYIKNASRQFLVVALPPQASLWSIRQADGSGKRQDVLSQESAAGILIPVSRPLDPNTPIEIEITYAEKVRTLGLWRSGLWPLRLEAPVLPDTPMTYASWTVQVPTEFAVGKSGGNMQSARPAWSGVLGALRKSGLLCLAVLDGPGRSRIRDILRNDRGAGQAVEFKKTVSLAGVDMPALKLWVVPAWIGRGGSVVILLVALVLGVMALLAGLVRGGSRSWQALGVTLIVIGAAEMATGRSLLAVLLFVALAWGAARLLGGLIGKGIRHGKRRRAARRTTHVAGPPPLGERAALSDDLPPFEPDSTGGFSRPGLLVLLGAVAAAAVLAATSTKAAEITPSPLVMDVVTVSVTGPVMTPDVELSADVKLDMVFETDEATAVLLASSNAVLKNIINPSDDLEITADFDGYWLRIADDGKYALTLEYQVPVTERAGKWSVDLCLPDNMRNNLTLTLPGTELEVTSEQAVLLASDETNQTTTVHAVFASREVRLSWQSRARQTRREKTLFFCEVNTLAVLQAGVIDLVNLLRYQVAQGEISEMKVLIPQGMSVTSVQAQNLATWSFDPSSGLLEAILDKPVAGELDLKIMTQVSRDGLPYSATLGVPRVEGAARQRGSFSIGAPDSVQLRMGETQGLSGMNIEDFSEAAVKAASTLSGVRHDAITVRRAYRYQNAADVTAEVSTEQVLPEIRVTENGTLSIADERIVLATKLDLMVARAGVFSIDLSIPGDYEMESLTGPDVNHWDDNRLESNAVERVEGERSVTVHFSRRVIDTTVLNLVMARMEKGIEEHVTVPRVSVAGAKKHGGRLTVSGERGVRMMVESRNGVDIKKASEEGIRQAGVLVFDILRPSWELVLKTEIMAPVVKPEVLQWVDLTEGMLQCRVFVRYQIENAGVNSFRLQVPYPDVPLTVAGRNVARVHAIDKAAGIWEVNLHSKVEDSYSLRASYQVSYGGDNGKVDLRPLRMLDTEDQRGYLVVTCGGRVQVTPGDVPAGLKPENARSVPALFGAGDLSGAVLCYRTLRPDYELPLSVVRHESADVLPASIDAVRIASVLSPSRRLLTKVELTMTVGELRFLRMALPNAGDELWTVMVNGSETAASREGDIYRIPLEQESGAATKVELIYAGEASSGRFARRQKYVAPQFLNLPLNDIRWTFYVSPELRYYSFGGTLSLEEPEHALGARTYSTEQYRQWNDKVREESLQLARQELDQGNQLVNKGKKREAQRAFQQALNYSQAQSDLNEDARVQLRNLVKQQVKIGLVNRRDANRFSQNIVDEQQLGQMEQFNDGEYTQEYASSVERRLSARDNTALEVVADKMIDQQAAAAGAVTAIRVTMPEDGRPLLFARRLQIDPSAELFVTFKAGGGGALRRGATAGLVLLLFAGCWLGLARCRRDVVCG